MSLAEIKAELPKLTREERASLAQELDHIEAFNDLAFSDPALVERLIRAVDDAEKGIGQISKEEMYDRLRAAGRAV